jgi:hypothetical protein
MGYEFSGQGWQGKIMKNPGVGKGYIRVSIQTPTLIMMRMASTEPPVKKRLISSDRLRE